MDLISSKKKRSRKVLKGGEGNCRVIFSKIKAI